MQTILKALGCAALRDGTYLLPAHVEQATQLQALADDALQEDGQAWLLHVHTRDMVEQAAFHALFDRGADYTPWLEELAQARQPLPALPAAERQRLLRRHSGGRLLGCCDGTGPQIRAAISDKYVDR